MSPFVERHQDKIAGVLSCFDRVVITGTLPDIGYAGAMAGCLSYHKTRLFDYPRWAEALRDELRSHAEQLAVDAGIFRSGGARPPTEVMVLFIDEHRIEYGVEPICEQLRWTEQNLKIKSFIGTSKNAVLTQIWIALCVYLLLAYIRFHSKLNKSLQQIVRLLQLNLFDKRDLMALLRGDPPSDNQFATNQLALL